MIELEEVLEGEPTLDQLREFWKHGDFHEERYVVQAIKRHLRNPYHKEVLDDLDLSIEDCLNGRYTAEQSTQVRGIYAQWNEKLGFPAFGT